MRNYIRVTALGRLRTADLDTLGDALYQAVAYIFFLGYTSESWTLNAHEESRGKATEKRNSAPSKAQHGSANQSNIQG